MSEKHVSVLLDEAIKALNVKENGIYVDATLGYGGHSSQILKKVKTGYLFAFDQDSEAIRHSTSRLSSIGTNFTIIKSNFKYLKEELEKRNINKVDGILFDLGVSSPELDEEDRGFSFHKDAPLDMRMNQEQKLTAADVVNKYSEEDLVNIFYKYGEDKYSRNIARKICEYRKEKEIETTLELVDIIKSAVPMKERLKKHPARQIFQAIRIEVNDELNVLDIAIKKALELLNVGGRVVVITFHSLEDRLIKKYFKEMTEVDEKIKGLPNIDSSLLPDYVLVNRKPVIPTDEEIENNNRSRSAKMRVIERIK
ncbi:MAG: 16S rRNA (cytosine(1402)-N(4))-methyltransferase RsmH [Bacilli bacterium]|nr:16S rRNA (cytosine(1402)-N(4))-methyltransferase RsmH [Bacilli bacterium]